MSDYKSDKEFQTMYCCRICDTSNMELDKFLQHTKKHTKKERLPLLEKLVNDTALANIEAKSAAAVFGFKLQPSVKSSVPLYVCVVCGQGNLMLKSLGEHSSLHPEFMESHYCNLCQHHFQDEPDLKFHLETHLDSNDLICQYCYKRFSIIEDLEVHESCHHRLEFVCVDCCQKFTSKHAVLTHLKDCHSNGLVCNICVQGFQTESLLDNHLITHTAVSSVKNAVKIFLCDVCGKEYDSKIALQRHNLFLHNKRIPLVCEFCGFQSYHQDSLREHLIKEHSDVTFQCTECADLFSEKFHFDTHMARHTEKKIFNCKYCGSRFRKLDNLKFHLKIHGRKGTSDSYLVESEDFLHGFETRRFTCKNCGESFNNQDLYNKHIKSHNISVCHLCRIAFNSDSDLNRHLHKVHPSKFSKFNSKFVTHPYKCEVCSASFRLEFELDEHSKNHIFYQCHLCFEEFVEDVQLQSHLEHAHKEEICENN